MALGFARGANYLERQGLAEEILYCCSVVHGEGYLVMLKGASEIFWFALGLFLFGYKAPAHPQQSRHTGINCCVQQLLRWLLGANASLPAVIAEGSRNPGGTS